MLGMHFNYDFIFKLISRCRKIKDASGSKHGVYTRDFTRPPNSLHFVSYDKIIPALNTDAVRRGLANSKAEKVTKNCHHEFHVSEDQSHQKKNSVSYNIDIRMIK